MNLNNTLGYKSDCNLVKEYWLFGILVIIEINGNIGTKWVNVVYVNDYLCIIKKFLVIAYKTVVKGKSQLLQVKGGLSKKKINFKKIIFIYFNESPLKMMKNAFYFMIKVLFVLDIFILLSETAC